MDIIGLIGDILEGFSTPPIPIAYPIHATVTDTGYYGGVLIDSLYYGGEVMDE